MDDDQEWSPAQLAWRSHVEMETDEQLRRDARFGGEALSRLVGCWQAEPRRKEPMERETRLDTAPPQKQGRGRLRPVLVRHGQDMPTTMYWTEWDREEGDGATT
jgi:hypothetical protein